MNYTRNELFSIAKRYNNLKRTYLIVNKKQSKYLPSKPSETFAMTNHNALNYTIHYQFNHSTVNVLYHTIPRRSPKGRRNR